MKNKFVAKLEKSDYLHGTLLKLSRLVRIRLLEENFKWNRFNTFEALFVVYAFIAYIYFLQKLRHDFDFVCFSTIVNAPILGGMYRLYNW